MQVPLPWPLSPWRHFRWSILIIHLRSGLDHHRQTVEVPPSARTQDRRGVWPAVHSQYSKTGRARALPPTSPTGPQLPRYLYLPPRR